MDSLLGKAAVEGSSPSCCEQKVREEQEAILKVIEETAKLWKDGDAHQMAEVLLARIRSRTQAG